MPRRGNREPRYVELIRNHPRHYSHFHDMIKRAKRKNLDCDFERTHESLARFIAHIGPIPEGMVWPSVGRYDHSIGYVVGNFRWKEYGENASDGAKDTVRDTLARGAHASQTGKTPAYVDITCPHCGKVGNVLNMKRWHFERCKLSGLNTLDQNSLF
jgi:hypothetical protein